MTHRLHELILYSPAIVLGLWSFVAALGLHGRLVVIVGLAATAVALALAEVERERRGRA